MSDTAETIRVPSPAKQQALNALLTEDEDFRFPKIKLNKNEKPRFEVLAPTAEDRDNIDLVRSFKAVVLIARKNFYQGDEEKARGEDPKEKRALYVLRTGKVTPELTYVSPSALRNWKAFCKEVVTSGHEGYWAVLCEFGAEHVKGKQFTWNKPTFKVSRTLTAEEREYVVELRAILDRHIRDYVDDSELDKYEDEASGVRTPEPEEVAERVSKDVHKSLEDDDPDDKPKPPKKTKTPPAEDDPPAPPAGKTNLPNLDDDEDSEGDPADPPAKPTVNLDDED